MEGGELNMKEGLMAKMKQEQLESTVAGDRSARGYKFLWMVEDKFDQQGQKTKSFWTKIGIAFENRDGSYSLDLAAVPVNGKLQMRDPWRPAPEGAAA